jgi:hypothetical protein
MQTLSNPTKDITNNQAIWNAPMTKCVLLPSLACPGGFPGKQQTLTNYGKCALPARMHGPHFPTTDLVRMPSIIRMVEETVP